VEIVEIPIEQLIISSNNTRKDLESGTDENNLNELANSIKKYGLINPITVVENENKYEVIAGQRRFQACKIINLSSIPCIIKKNINLTQTVSISLIENVQRADMGAIDKGKAYVQLLKTFDSIESLSNNIGVGAPTIKKYISLLELSPTLQRTIDSREGTLGIDALSRLSKSFQNNYEQELVHDRLKGFNQKVQIEMIKNLNGSVESLTDVVRDAQEGVFDLQVCTRGLCNIIPDDFEQILKEELLKKRKITWLEFMTKVANGASTAAGSTIVSAGFDAVKEALKTMGA